MGVVRERWGPLAAGGPAELSGLVLVGDTLVTVDGRPVKGIPYDELTPLILGSENSQVQFGLRRPSQPHMLVMAELRRGRVGPVGRPAERKSRQSSSARAQRVQRARAQCPGQRFLSFAGAPPHLPSQPEARAAYEARLREAGADVVIPSTANLLESLLPQLG